MLLNGLKAFLILILPAAIVFGILGALIRRNFEGHEKEEWIVKGSMLVMSIAYIAVLYSIFG